MNLSIFFNSIPETVLVKNSLAGSWQNYIRPFVEDFPSWKEADLAIIGITEDRGTSGNKGLKDAADSIRKELYQLKKGTGAYRIADLGNLRNGETYDETILRLKEVCEALISAKVIPIIIGGSHDIQFGQYLGYESSGKAITLLNIDSRLDMTEEAEPSESHIRKLLTHHPNFLFHYSQLAYQSFLVEKEHLEAFEKLYFELYRLGQVRESLEETEPIIRTADMISFDISAIKISDAPGNAKAGVFGLTGEDACQLCWYAGVNSRMSSIGFYEYNPELDNRNQTASVIATMIWYFTEGYYHRHEEINVSDNRFTKYIVALKEEPHSLVFYKDTLTEKWWMEVPVPEGKEKLSGKGLLPCSYKDYKEASSGEIPNRWIITHAKMS